jgi:hypothetical protein
MQESSFIDKLHQSVLDCGIEALSTQNSILKIMKNWKVPLSSDFYKELLLSDSNVVESYFKFMNGEVKDKPIMSSDTSALYAALSLFILV